MSTETAPERDTAVAAPGLTTTVAGPGDAAAWDAFVRTRADACGYHEWAWRAVFERAFGHECVYLVARAGADVAGVLPLVFIRSPLFGRSLTSLPFLNYGGVLAASPAAARALVEAAGAQARERRCGHVELRHVARRFDDLPCRAHKVTMTLPLAPGLWERLDRKVRNQIRKAEKSGLTAASGGAELLDEFYPVFARNMRDLGTPVYAPTLFAEVLRAFPDRARLTIVRLKGQAIAGGLTFRTGGTVEVPWASSIRDYNALCPNHLLYWHILESAVALGATTMDFGRSTPGEGTFKFKQQWGASPVELHWEYVLNGGSEPPDQSPKNPKFRLAIAAWKRLPLWAANAVGPHLVRGIP
ncbi:MAG: FemAB family PEP-CTERM system-associated protein [Vicinamibacterales bacterium]